MKHKYYGGLLIPPPLISSVQAVDRCIHPVFRPEQEHSLCKYLSSGAKAIKFLLFDISTCLGAFCISRKLGSSLLFRALTKNGPVVMKIGQFLSTRLDILPEEAISRLKVLQSLAPTPRQNKHPLDIFYDETGILLPHSSLQGEVGAGCISRVYKVRIGEKDYALKIIDPKTRESAQIDLDLFETFSKLLGFSRFYQEFKRNMLVQLDLRKEKKNTERFRKNFALFQSPLENKSLLTRVLSKFSNTSVVFPKPVAATESILLTEYWKGEEIDAKSGESILFLFLKMAFKDRFVHSDFHPGNLSVIKDSKKRPGKSTIIVYDSGLTHSLTKEQSRNLADLIKTVLLDKKKKALSLLIERNSLNTHTEEKKNAFLTSAAEHWNRANTKNTSALDRALKVYFLARRHNIFLDSAYTNMAMSAIYMQNHIKEVEQVNWTTALKSGVIMDYLDLFMQWKAKQFNLSGYF
ncbi:hypothetical protein NEMIN01_1037 [Nematocida minor]|uniref:uncharacterized protein n=1 Tax=Nematocida minor TaxID=1912983 RepID=UPI00221F1CD4|nr:uncharacterized protein NEMIN01_1037 [Nematocida minor]KAI5190413.1 hypothetical protein NEMIN01_1037 [Nematocida minor]